jgi:VanZ family protein
VLKSGQGKTNLLPKNLHLRGVSKGNMMKDFIIYWLPPIAWMAFIFPTNNFLTFNSTSRIIVPIIKWLLPHANQYTIETLHMMIRKCGHFFEYGFLAYLLLRGIRGGNKRLNLKWIIYAGLITIGYGALDEFLQTFISSRTGSVYDWMIDSAGTVFVLSFIYIKSGYKVHSKLGSGLNN